MSSQDLLLSSRRGQSQKPQEIYTVAESFAACGNSQDISCSAECTSSFRTLKYLGSRAGTYIEVFGRRNNLRSFWITIGNEVIGSCNVIHVN